MEMWAWLAAYVLGFALLQFYLYRYFVGGDSTTESATPDSPSERISGAVERSAGSVDSAGDGEESLRCENCGARNENHPMFVFCGDCGTKLR
jgi:hypothetical protein